MPIWDKLRPQSAPRAPVEPVTPVITAPTVETVAPVTAPEPAIAEKVTPVEVTPDFSNPVQGTPFGQTVEFAARYYGAAVEAGRMTPEISQRLAAFADMSRELSTAWRDEQEAAEAERLARHPFKVLEDALVEGTKRQYGVLNQEGRAQNISREMARTFDTLKTKYDQEKLVGGEASDSEILDRVMASREVYTTLDMGKIMEGYGQDTNFGNTKFPFTELSTMLKALGAIPAEAPGADRFPIGHENQYLTKLMESRGATSTEVKVEYYGSQPKGATEYTCATRIPGVNVVVGIMDRYADGHREISANGYPIHEGLRLELTKPFLAEALGIKLPETQVDTPTPDVQV